jgi:lipoate-protein ligase A
LTRPWRIGTATGPAAHFLDPLPATERAIRINVIEDTAVILGSTQPESHVDAARAAAGGVAVLRRRSGGGAVLVGPGQLLWIDVVVPVDDPLWTPDVGRAFWWLGDVWVAALEAAGILGGLVWRGGLVRSPWSDRVCFAGLGSGEVVVGNAKVVGLSQRRTRAGAHFQCAVPISWDPAQLLAVMALGDDARSAAETDLAAAARGVGAGVSAGLLRAFLERLPKSDN